MDSDYLLCHIPPMAGAASIVFTTEGSTFAPVLIVSGNPSIRWIWADGTTSQAVSGESVTKTGFGTGRQAHYLMISDGAALTRFGGGDGSGAGHLTAMSGFENCPSLRILTPIRNFGQGSALDGLLHDKSGLIAAS